MTPTLVHVSFSEKGTKITPQTCIIKYEILERKYLKYCPSHLSITKLPNNQITKFPNLFLIFFLVLGQIFLKKAKRSKFQDDYAIQFGSFEKFLAKNQKNIKNRFGNLVIWKSKDDLDISAQILLQKSPQKCNQFFPSMFIHMISV